MKCDVYAVARQGDDDWGVDLNGQTLGSGMDRARAERAAVTAARMSKGRGREAVILAFSDASPVSPAVVAAVSEIARYATICSLVAHTQPPDERSTAEGGQQR